MNRNKFKHRLFTLCCIVFFSITYSISISLLLDPNHLAPGGVSGISIMLNHLFSLPVGLMIFLINVPLLLISFIKLGKMFFFKTLFSIALTTVFIDLISASGIPPLTTNPILAAFYGGLLMAASLAFLFKVGATTGGSDIIIRLLKLKFPHVETGKLFLIIDSTIVAMSAIVFKSVETALYAALVILVSSIFLDKILYGTNKLILMLIITEKSEEVTDALLHKLDTGVTYLKGAGAYDGNERNVIMCAMKKSKYPKAEKLIFNIDKDSFMIITSANEILGKGFRAFDDERI